MFQKYTKRCPRCDEKNPINAYKCPSCGLVFDRLKLATNKAGKDMLRQGKKDKVIWTKDFPSDLKRSKAIILCLTLGLFGGHCYYVGRWTKAILMSIFGTLTMVIAFLMVSNSIPDEVYITSQIVGAIPLFVWMFDISAVIFKKFKVPIYIETPEVK